jgi:hypothetical protein
MDFLNNGCLAPGVYNMTWVEFYHQFSYSPKRKILLEGLEKAIEVLRQFGCTLIYIDGSYVTQKLEPNDYDACWDGDFDVVCTNMLKLEPIFLDFSNGRKNQKLEYKGEIFPAGLVADAIGTLYLDFFQQIRFSKEKKGIVAIKL